MKQKSYPVLTIGFSSILVVFVILSLTVFAMLSFVSANSDEKLTHQVTDQTDEYYTASKQAEEVYAQIDRILYGCSTESAGKQDYLSACRSSFSAGDAIDGAVIQYDDSGDMPRISYQIPMSGTQALSVVLTVRYPDQAGEKFCDVSAWQTTDTQEWDPDTSLPVYGNGNAGN